jgi:alkanesulfonate monooxygenase SsuD/methylene tetrahydromethanopterin reductase-like flavin-dependent oxidoreductase (luciferase family)
MRVSFCLPFAHPDGTACTPEEIAGLAKAIEAAGFHGIYLGDVVGRGVRGDGQPYPPRPDPLMWLLVAALATERVELGTAVMQVAVRAPVDLAQRLLTMHVLTGGRFVAGLGAGSTPNDFEASGVEFADRFKVLSRNLSIIQRLWNGEQVGSAHLRPWINSVGGPPIVIGSWVSGIWIKRAAREFDGWMASGGGPGGATFGNLKEGIKTFREEGGKRAMVATVATDLRATTPPLSDDRSFSLRCSPAEAGQRAAVLDELGFDDLVLRNDNLTQEDVLQVSEALGLNKGARAGTR